jgi:hypothetical protein
LLAGACVLGAAVLASGIVPAVASAQTATGNVRGYVTATAGAPLSDAQVGARLLSTNALRGTTTNEAGFYYLAGLRPGAYEITVRRIGMQPQTRQIQVPIGQTIDLNFQTGEVATQLSAVEVTARASGTQTKTSEVGTNISREQIENLPTFERNVLDLAKLAPGMTAQNVNSTDKTFAAGGQPPEAINVFVDGATYKNDVLKGGVAGQDASKGNPLPQGAIQEFRVLTQNYKAEYQKAASAIIVATTKSGSNVTEADFFANGVGKAYVAKDRITAIRGGSRPRYQRLQAGGNIGGPIIKDKLFYFGTYELNFRDEPAYITFGGDSLVAPVALKNSLRPLLGQQVQEFREHNALAKLTWNGSERNTVDGSFTLRKDDDFRGFGGQTAFEAAENLRVDTYTGVVNWKHAGDKYLNEAQFNSQWFTWNPTARDFNLIAKDYQGLLRVGGKDSNQDFKQTRYSFRDDVTRAGIRLAGDHVVKGGASVDFLKYDAIKYNQGNPTFRFNNATANFSRPFEVGLGFGDPHIASNNTQFGVYLQDDWSIGRNLVLNLGLRWDGETNMINNDYVTPAPLADTLRAMYAANQLVVTQPTGVGTSRTVNVVSELGGIERYLTTGSSDRPWYKKAFQPRVGFAYDFAGDGSTVLFGGAGIYYDRNYWNTLFDERFRRQYSQINISFQPVTCGTTPNCAVWDPKYYDPAQLRALALVAGKPEVFLVANDLIPPSTLQLSGGLKHQFGLELVTLSYNGIRGRHFMNFVRGGPFGGGSSPYNTVFLADDRVKTWYNSVQLQIQREMTAATRWGGQLAYTLAKSEEQGQSTDIFWGFDDRYPTVADRPRLRTPGDQRHAIVANGIVRAPFGFLASTIINLGSGVTVNASNESAGGGVGQRFTYVFTPPGRAFLGVGKPFAFQNMDIRLQKDFDILSAGQRVGLAIDFFNVFNSANFGCYDTTIRTPTNLNYGKPGCAGLGRRLQVGLRYSARPSLNALRKE